MAAKKHSKQQVAGVIIDPTRFPHLTVENITELERTLRHIDAALSVVTGGHSEPWQEVPPDVRDDYLCMCRDLSEKAHTLATLMMVDAEVAHG